MVNMDIYADVRKWTGCNTKLNATNVKPKKKEKTQAGDVFYLRYPNQWEDALEYHVVFVVYLF